MSRRKRIRYSISPRSGLVFYGSSFLFMQHFEPKVLNPEMRPNQRVHPTFAAAGAPSNAADPFTLCAQLRKKQ